MLDDVIENPAEFQLKNYLVDVFAPNAGQQCVAMSLCALIYNDSTGNRSINNSGDLIQIMNIGNELYAALSRL